MKQFNLIFFILFLAGNSFYQSIFFDDFEDVFKPQWVAQTDLNGLIDIVESAGITNSRAARMGKRIDGDFSVQSLDLYLDLANEEDVEISFWIRSNYDETHSQDGIYFSNDGGDTFYKALDFKPTNWCPNVWGQYPPLDIDDIAANIETAPNTFGLTLNNLFVIRIQQRGNTDFAGGTSQNDGFILDDVNVSALTTSNSDQSGLDHSISTFPNPITNHLTIKSTTEIPLKNGQINIYNILGIRVHQEEIDNINNQIDLIHLIPEVYFLTINDDSQLIFSSQFLKEQ